MEAKQGLSVSRGLIGGWPDESELGARPSLLAPARAAGSAPPRSRFVPGDGSGGCREQRAKDTDPPAHGPPDWEAGRARSHAQAPAPRPAPSPARSHGPAGEWAAPRRHSVAPADRASRCLHRRIADAQQVGYVTAPALHPVPLGLERGALVLPGVGAAARGGQARLGLGAGQKQREWEIVSDSVASSHRGRGELRLL